jgi:hypothetical protein
MSGVWFEPDAGRASRWSDAALHQVRQDLRGSPSAGCARASPTADWTAQSHPATTNTTYPRRQRGQYLFVRPAITRSVAAVWLSAEWATAGGAGGLFLFPPLCHRLSFALARPGRQRVPFRMDAEISGPQGRASDAVLLAVSSTLVAHAAGPAVTTRGGNSSCHKWRGSRTSPRARRATGV